MGKRILVTGATGFVGRALVPSLLESGFELTLLVRASSTISEALNQNPRVRLITIGEWGAEVENAIKDVFAVVHMAGRAHVRHSKDQGAFFAVNAEITQRLVNIVQRRGGVSLFIYLSSLAAITSNSRSSPANDHNAPKPVTAYGSSKLAAESCVAELAEQGITAISIRPPLIVGPDGKGNWARLQWLAASGIPLPFARVHNKRSLISVETLAEAITHLCCIKPPASLSGSYCVADPEALSLDTVLRELRGGLGISPRLFPLPRSVLAGLANVPGLKLLSESLFGNLEVDSSRFYATFSFNPSVPISTAIRTSGMKYRSMHSIKQF